MDARRTLLELFDSALRAVDGRVCVRRALQGRAAARFALFAVGKAAGAMALGAHDALGVHEAFGYGIGETFIVTKDGHVDRGLARLARTTVLEAAHPFPDERSLAAGAELEHRLARLEADVHPIFLISGGSSSLIECLREGVTLAELRALNEHGFAAGLDIAALNAERTRLSRLKGGGVARLLGMRSATALLVSDVPGDDPGVIGSGLLGTAAGHRDGILRVVVASVDAAVRAVVMAAQARGLTLETRAARFAGDAAGVARDFLAALRDTSGDGVVWGGESTVKLNAHPGRGGRNTHLALVAAREMGMSDSFTILAAGTDGTDGPTDDAGAIVDPHTVERAELAGCDVERACAEFDSGTALEAAEDLVHTGPTGTNVGDILIGLKRRTGAFRGQHAGRVL